MNLANIAGHVTSIVNMLEPILAAADPGVGRAVDIGAGIVKAAIAGSTAAAALIAQVKNGVPLTPAQVAAADANFDASIEALDAALAAADPNA